MHDPTSLSGKVAVVLGASGGIGAATARALAGAGATVVATWRTDRAAGEALVAALPGTGHLALPAAVEDTPSLAELAATVERRLGRLQRGLRDLARADGQVGRHIRRGEVAGDGAGDDDLVAHRAHGGSLRQRARPPSTRTVEPVE